MQQSRCEKRTVTASCWIPPVGVQFLPHLFGGLTITLSLLWICREALIQAAILGSATSTLEVWVTRSISESKYVHWNINCDIYANWDLKRSFWNQMFLKLWRLEKSSWGPQLWHRHANRHRTMARPNFPLAGIAGDGWSKEDEATATCFCGTVQLAFVSSALIHLLLSQFWSLALRDELEDKPEWISFFIDRFM